MNLKNNWFSNDYTDKKIVRIGMTISFLLILVVIFTNGLGNFVYVYCPGEKEAECLNPLYICEVGETPSINTCSDGYINKHHETICLQGGCERYLMPYEEVGKKINFFGRNVGVFIFLTLFFTGLINHFNYRIKNNKKKLEKHKKVKK